MAGLNKEKKLKIYLIEVDTNSEDSWNEGTQAKFHNHNTKIQRWTFFRSILHLVVLSFAQTRAVESRQKWSWRKYFASESRFCWVSEKFFSVEKMEKNFLHLKINCLQDFGPAIVQYVFLGGIFNIFQSENENKIEGRLQNCKIIIFWKKQNLAAITKIAINKIKNWNIYKIQIYFFFDNFGLFCMTSRRHAPSFLFYLKKIPKIMFQNGNEMAKMIF